MKVVIMAGGLGTRIASIASDVPKPMIPVCGKPILEYQIACLKRNGLTDISIVIGHLGHVIRNYFGDGKKLGVHISYFTETEPLGTAGALFRMPELTEDFLLLCGDIIFDIDFTRLLAFHREKKALATLVSHPNGHPYDSSLLITETEPPVVKGGMPVETHRVIRWLNKEDDRSSSFYKNRVNAGIEVISPELLKMTVVKRQKIDLDRDILKPNIASGKIFAYDTPEYIKDMGTPDRYYQTENDIKSGLVSKRNLSRKQQAVFLDRDGTINKENGFITAPEQLELLPGTAQAVRTINKSGYLAIVVTNQPVIARGDCTFEQLQLIHNKLETLLGAEGAYIDALYFCPHHPDKGFSGERPEYKHECSCRKPRPGMLLQAARDFNIAITESFMVGDREKDVETGIHAGCKKSIQISEAYTLKDFVSEYVQ